MQVMQAINILTQKIKTIYLRITNFELLYSHQQVFHKLKARFAHEISVSITYSKYPFIYTPTPLIQELIQQFPEGKRSVSKSSCVFDRE